MTLWPIGAGLLVVSAAWLGWRASSPGPTGVVATWLGWFIAGIFLVVTTGLLASAAGSFWAETLMALHGLQLGSLWALRRRVWKDDWRACWNLFFLTRERLISERLTGWATLTLGFFLLGTGILAASAEPVVFDALTYRLPRIAHWLQDGRIGHFATNDPRQNYMPVVPDVMMAWLIAANPTGWKPVALAQWFGGVALLVATIGLARHHGLGRNASVGAALICAGMANVAPQFTSVHTDLITGGLLATAIFLCHESIRGGRCMIVGGVATGLALGAKGTVFYFAPTLLLWVAWHWRISRPNARILAFTGGAAVASVLIFAAPTWRENWRAYGGPFGPADFVAMHHRGGVNPLPEKTLLNVISSFAQNLEPHSQPPGLRGAASKLGGEIAGRLPEQDEFSFEGLNRRETLLSLLERKIPDADATAVGIVPLAFFALGLLAALFRRGQQAARTVIVSATGVIAYLVFFHAMQQWHPYGFRYFVLAAPWIAIVAAFGLTMLPRLWRITGWSLALGGATLVAAHTLTESHQAGWLAVTQPTHSRGRFVVGQWADWIRDFDHAGKPLFVSLPFNRPLAAFYRQGFDRKVKLLPEANLANITAEEALTGLSAGWLVVPAARFLGNEGRVLGRVWLYDGEPGNVFSIAAYRLLAASEVAPPLLYRHVATLQDSGVRHELLVRPGEGGRITLRFSAEYACSVVIALPSGVSRGELPKGEHEKELLVAENQVSEVIIQFTSSDPLRARDFPQVSLKL